MFNFLYRLTGDNYLSRHMPTVTSSTIRSGKTKDYTKIADSGKKITRQFCPECGSPLFTRAEVCPGMVWIKAGSLDSPELIKPTHQTWIEMAVPWAYLDKDLPSFQGNGPSPGEKTR